MSNPRFTTPPRVRGFYLGMICDMAPRLTLLILLFAVTGCGESDPVTPPPLAGEPTVRVRIGRAVNRVAISGGRVATVLPVGAAEAELLDLPLAFQLQQGVWLVNGQAKPDWSRAMLIIALPGGEPLAVDNRTHAGQVHLVPASGERSRFDVINAVGLETYLPGVLKKELPDRWHVVTHQAQAIAARSYALYKLQRTPVGRAWDVENTQASQAYVGLTDHAKSVRAVRDTTGLVLSYDNRVLCAYYASNSGGQGLSPDDAFNESPFPTPLKPTHRKDWTTDTPGARWGPIERHCDTLAQRFAAFGKRRGLPLAKIDGIKSITVSRYNDVGRPARFTITDQRGESYTLAADNFRVACNTSAGQALASKHKLPSASVQVRVRDGVATFYAGRGRGHGVGLCQHGAQQMAKADHDALEILETYYPGAKVERAY